MIEKKKFDRNKPNLNVSTMGHVDHGKSTLTSGITYVQSLENKAKFLEYEKIDNTPEEKRRKITISVYITEYETEKYHVIHSDAPGHEDYVKNATVSFSQVENGILVVSGIHGINTQTREHVNLAKRIGIKKIIVAVTKLDLASSEKDKKLYWDISVMSMTELLEQYGFDKSNFKILPVSAWKALQKDKNGIEEVRTLIKTMDDFFETPALEKDQPFLMSVESTYVIKGRGCVVAGKVYKGRINKNDKLHLSGLTHKPIEVKVLDLEMFNKKLDYVEAGDNPGILLSSTDDRMKKGSKFPTRGQVLIWPGSYLAHSKFVAQIYITTAKEGGRNKGFSVGYQPQFFIRTAYITGTIQEISTIDSNSIKIEFAKPGDVINLKIELISNVVLNLNDNIVFREGKKTIGSGKVIKIIE